MMHEKSADKGRISTIPEIPGLCVWMPGHIGVYIGGREVIESKGTTYGVIRAPLTGQGASLWTLWFKAPYISYIKDTGWKDILQMVADDPKGWEAAIEGLAEAAKIGVVNSLYQYLPLLIEKIYDK